MAPPPKPPFLPKQQAIREMKIEKSEAETTWLAMKLTELDLQTRTAAPARFIKFGGLSGSTAREFEELSKSQSGLNAPVLDCIYKAMGDDAFKAGRHAEAAKFYKKGTKLTTPNAEACWSNRCLALIKIKRYEAALRAHKNATRLHARMHGPGIDEHYAKFDYRLGLILKALGMYERAEYHLMRSLRLDSQKSEVTKTALDQVRAQLEVLDTRYKGQRRSRGELDGRREESGNFTLSDEEIEMLFAAGAMPWDYGVEDILMAGRDIDEEEAKMLNYDTEEDAEKEGSLRAIIEGFEIERMKNPEGGTNDTPLRHRLLLCQQCGKSKASGIKLLKCLRCGVATYCSKECQKQHWPYHKPQCDLNVPNKDNFLDSESLLHQLRSWTSRHRPTFSEVLPYGLDIHQDRAAFERKAVIYVLDHVSKAKRTAEKFKIVDIGAVSVDALMKINPSCETFPEQRLHRHRELLEKRPDLLGVAFYLLLGVSGEGFVLNFVPVGLGHDVVSQVPPLHWKEKAKWTINSGTTL